ncbi:MAG: translation initiation factor IF-1 [Patescibacteria group bacterium]|nr:translation initiation factor IF-1 [Patescibacteria group bacterium]
MAENNFQNQGEAKGGKTLNAKDFIEMQGEVLELMPDTTFKILLENGHEIFAYLSGKMRMHKIRLLPGDKVRVQISPYDLTKGRVVYRL